jgi:iron complex outermembrane receptor protein
MLASWPAAAQQQAAGNDGGLEEIVVTAQRREERLQDVPIAVTALSASVIEANRVQNVRDLTGLAPGLTVNSQSGGQNTAGISLRGVTSTAFFPGQSAGVGTYVDGVYLGSVNGTILDIADIERIEVLRGPQGTLFGRNSNGGAISITTRMPSGNFGVRQELTYGNYKQFRSKTRVDLPRLGAFTATIVFVHDERRGDIRNLGGGTQWDWGPSTGGVWGIRTSPKYLGNANKEGLGVTVRFQPADNVDIVYKFDLFDHKYSDLGNGILGFVDGPTGALTPYSGLAALLYSQVPANLRTPITSDRPKAVNNWFATPAHQRQTGHALIATYNPSSTVTLKNILSYRKNRVSGNSELDGLGGLIDSIGAFGTVGAPIVLTGAAFVNPERQITNESQVNFNNDAFNLTAGFYYYAHKGGNGPAALLPGLGGPQYSGNYAFSDLTPPYTLPNVGTLRTLIRTRSKAVYAQGTYHITPQLDVVGGLRHTWDHIFGVDNGFSPTVSNIRYNFKDQKTTWLAGVNYKPTTDVLAYAKVSTGYISGGGVNGITYETEDAISYEVGVKADFGRSLRVNVALFQADYDGLQVVGFVDPDPTDGAGITPSRPAVQNIADARVRGLELEATWIPVRGLTLGGGLSYNRFKYKKIDPRYLQLNGITADQLLKSRRPKLTGSGSVQYESVEMPWGGHVVARLDAIYRGAEDLANSYTGPISRDFLRSERTVLVNGRLALTDIPIGGIKGEIAGWVRNLTNVKEVRGVINGGANYAANYEAARTFGIDLIAQF